MELTIQDLVDIVGGRLRLAAMPPLGGMWEPIGNFVTSPLEASAGDVFIALPNLQQQDFWCVEQAFDRGALGVVHCGKPLEPRPGRFSIQVDDTPWALWQLARFARDDFDGRVVAVAGSVGKSITCAMIEAVLDIHQGERAYDSAVADRTLAEQMLRLTRDDWFAVWEIHAASEGEFDSAAHLSRPHVAVVLNPYGDHTIFEERSGNPLGHSAGKEMISALPDDGSAIVGPTRGEQLNVSSCNSIQTFGRHGGCDLSASHVVYTDGRLSFVVDGQITMLNVNGRHYLDSALAAWSVGRAMGIDDASIATRLQHTVLPSRRCEVSHGKGASGGDVTFIDDSGCRSLSSLRAPLELMLATKGRRRIVITGNVSESDDINFRWGNQMVAVGGADAVVAVGADTDEIIRGAIDAGMPRTQCIRCDASDLEQEIFTFLTFGDVVLLKGVDSELAYRVLALFSNISHIAAA